MFYDVPQLKNGNPAEWPPGCGYVAATDINGNPKNIPVIPNTSIAVFGQPGYGKTVFTISVVKALLQVPDSSASMPVNRRTVFFQVKPDDYTREFLRTKDKVITYSSSLFSGHIFYWNMIREFRLASDPEALMKKVAALLFSDMLEDPRTATWAGPASETFCAFCRVILKRYHNCPSNKEVITALKNYSADRLMKHLAELPEHKGILQSYFEYCPSSSDCQYHMTRKGSDIRYFLNQTLQKFSGTFINDNGTDTIHEFLSGEGDKRLFILHDDGASESSRPFEKLFLELMISHQLSLSTSHKADMLLVLDEVDKLGTDFGLNRAVNQGREMHLRTILSTQSFENLFAIGPEKNTEHLTNAMLTGFPVTAFFHPGDAATRKAAQGLYGDTRKETLIMPLSRYERPATSVVTVPMVTDEDFSHLGIGDAYVKIRDCDPVRVHIQKE